MNQQKKVAVLLVVSSFLLAILVPGGPIETRSFSHISPLILGSFNTFLTLLGMLSLPLAYFVFKMKKWAYIGSIFAGFFYFAVYVSDLAHIFPVSPDAMPPLLLVIEVAGTILSIPLIHSSYVLLKEGMSSNETFILNKKLFIFIFFALLVALGIIVFATNAAMGNR